MAEDKIFCRECGEQIPDELFTTLLDQEPIYCESCGAEIYKKDYNLQHIRHIKTKQKQKTLVDLLSIARKKTFEYKDKIKSKLKEIKERPRD
ncbi:MAG: hypothetical protein ACFFDK_18435 [Promethearchaeota archaeon]